MATQGRTYPTNFIGPIRPQDTRASAGFIGPTYGYSAPQQQQVLGSSTQRASTPAPSGGGQPAPQQQNQPSEPDYGREIEDAFSGAFSALNQQETSAQQGYGEDTTNLNAQLTNELGKADKNQADLLGASEVEQGKVDRDLSSALEGAIRAYNALNQQKIARYGGGSSAGQAIGELAQQEFFRQQGQVNQKQADTSAQFASERDRIRTYVAQKKTDLEQWGREALTELTKNLRLTLDNIASRRGGLQADKSAMRLQALQSAREAAQAIAVQDKQFRQNIALAAVSKMQEVAGRAFSPAEISAYMADFDNAYVGGGKATSPVASQGTPLARRPATQGDEFATINPIYGSQGNVG